MRGWEGVSLVSFTHSFYLIVYNLRLYMNIKFLVKLYNLYLIIELTLTKQRQYRHTKFLTLIELTHVCQIIV